MLDIKKSESFSFIIDKMSIIWQLSGKAGFGRSLFGRLVNIGLKKHLLNVQYRMHPAISFFPNRVFYKNKIMDGRNVKEAIYEKRFLKGNIFGSYSFIK